MRCQSISSPGATYTYNSRSNGIANNTSRMYSGITFTENYLYDGLWRMTGINGNYIKSDYIYDSLDRLTDYSLKTGSGSQVSSQYYTYKTAANGSDTGFISYLGKKGDGGNLL